MSKGTVSVEHYEALSERVAFLEGINLDLAQACESMRKERDRATKDRDKAILQFLRCAENLRRVRAGGAA